MNSRKSLLELCAYTIISLVIMFVSFNSSLVYIVALFAIPALISYVFCISGKYEFVFSVSAILLFNIVASVISFGLETAFINFVLSIMLIVPGIIAGYCFKNKLSFSHILFGTTVFDGVVLIAILAYSKYALGINFYSDIREEVLLAFENALPVIKSLSKDMYNIFEQNEKEIFFVSYKIIPSLFPFFIALVIIILNLAKYVVCRMFCNSYLIQNSLFINGFDTFAMNGISNISLIIFVLVVFGATSDNITMVFVNALLTLLLLYFVAGVAFLEFKLKQKSVKYLLRALYILLIFAATVILSVFIPVINLFYIMIFVAFLDSIFDFRKLKCKKG